jgi:hypothetical protein
MIRLLADENFDQDLVRGVLRRLPGFDVVRARVNSFSTPPSR